jgi:hypothetical protein
VGTGVDFEDGAAAHQFSKTFHTRWAFRPEPERFVATLNQWLAEEAGLLAVSPLLHRAVDGIGAATLHCTASLSEVPYVFRFDRLSLVKGTLAARPVTDLGSALNEWKDTHREADVAWYQVFSAPNGRPTECWILSAVDRADAPSIELPAPMWGFMGVQRLPVALLFPIFLLIFIAGLVSPAETPASNFAVFGAITAALGWSFFRFPVWRRSRESTVDSRT